TFPSGSMATPVTSSPAAPPKVRAQLSRRQVPAMQRPPGQSEDPSSFEPSQSLSTPSQISRAPGFTFPSESSQSVPQIAPLQHAAETKPSESASRSPTVVSTQSSSWCASQISRLPG